MSRRLRASGWLLSYIALAAAPLAVAMAGPSLRSPRWTIEAAVALGVVAYALLTMHLALVSRISRLSEAIGSDALLQFHREMAIVALAFVAGHAFVLREAGGGWRLLSPLQPNGALGLGAASLWLVVLIAVTSFARRALHLSYEAWQAIHLASACLIAVAALAHVIGMGRYSSAGLFRWVVCGYAVLFVGLLGRYRIVRPIRLSRRPWEIVENADAGGSTRLVTLRPIGHRGLMFRPGQFAWLMTGRTPLFSQQHPLSLASAPGESGQVQFAIKALGDWSGEVVPRLPRGHRVWIDGPYGAFTPEPGSSTLVLIAGGIGIAPLRSILLAERAAGSTRPIVLFYAASNRGRAALAAEIDALQRHLRLTLIFVFEHPEGEWTGERGFITADTLRRHVPGRIGEAEYFVCGPVPMMDAIERIRRELGIPSSRVHTERFHVV